MRLALFLSQTLYRRHRWHDLARRLVCGQSPSARPFCSRVDNLFFLRSGAFSTFLSLPGIGGHGSYHFSSPCHDKWIPLLHLGATLSPCHAGATADDQADRFSEFEARLAEQVRFNELKRTVLASALELVHEYGWTSQALAVACSKVCAMATISKALPLAISCTSFYRFLRS